MYNGIGYYQIKQLKEMATALFTFATFKKRLGADNAQVDLGDGVAATVAYPQPYGFSASPTKGDAVIISPSATTTDGVLILVAGQPPITLGDNEVIIYNTSAGSYIHLKANGDVHVKGKLVVDGDVVADGTSLKNHTHQVTAIGSPTSPPIGGTP